MNIKLKAKTINSKKAFKEIKNHLPSAASKEKLHSGAAGYVYNIKDKNGCTIARLANNLAGEGLILHVKEMPKQNYTWTTSCGNIIAQINHVSLA